MPEPASKSCRRGDGFACEGRAHPGAHPPLGRDLRIVVASGRIVGAVQRLAAPGEWRTNVAGRGRTTSPPLAARELALAAAATVDADLAGIDLLPTPTGGWVVIEVNGAVEFETTRSTATCYRAAEALADAAFGQQRESLSPWRRLTAS